MAGESDGVMRDLVLSDTATYNFMPLVENTSFSGEITMRTRSYLGNEISQVYAFEQTQLEANHIHSIETNVTHPEDKSVVMFLTQSAYEQGNHSKILQDDEPRRYILILRRESLIQRSRFS